LELAESEIQELRVRAAINYGFAIRGWWRRKRKIDYWAAWWLRCICFAAYERENSSGSFGFFPTPHAQVYLAIHSLSISITSCVRLIYAYAGLLHAS